MANKCCERCGFEFGPGVTLRLCPACFLSDRIPPSEASKKFADDLFKQVIETTRYRREPE